MMRALVTGGTGFVGINLVQALHRAGARVTVLARPAADTAPLAGAARIVRGDLLDPPSLAGVLGQIDTVFHLAGSVRAHSPQAYWRHNAQATAHLAQAMRRQSPAGAQLIFLSSLAASGPNAVPPGQDENAPPAPVSAYGISKRAAELLALAEGKRRPVAIVRAPILYGPWDRALLPFFQWVRRGIIAIPQRGDMRFSLLHVSDLSALLLRLAEIPGSGCRLWHACDGQTHTWQSLGKTAARIMGRRCRTLTAPPGFVHTLCRLNGILDRFRDKASFLNPDKWREIRHPGWLCDGSSVHRELGLSPRYNLEQGVGDTLSWYRQAGWM